MPGQYNPESILEEQLESQRQQIQKHYQLQWSEENRKARDGIFGSQKEYEQTLHELHVQWKQTISEFDSKAGQATSQLQQIDKLYELGAFPEGVDPNELKWNLVSPKNARAMFPKQRDPQDMLRDNLATQNRLMQTTDAFVKKGGKLYASLEDEDGYYTGEANMSKPAAPEEIQKWAMTGDALSTLEQQEQDILLEISGAGMPDPSRLQRLGTDQRRKSFFSTLADIGATFAGPGVRLPRKTKQYVSTFTPESPGTFAQKIQRDIAPARTQAPRTQAPRKQSRQELLTEYKRLGGSRTAEGRAYADRNLK